MIRNCALDHFLSRLIKWKCWRLCTFVLQLLSLSSLILTICLGTTRGIQSSFVRSISKVCIGGPIPNTLGKLTKLRVLRLWVEDISSCRHHSVTTMYIPSNLQDLANLEVVEISASLTGTLDWTFSRTPLLRTLSIAYIGYLDSVEPLSGTIDSSLWNLKHLTNLCFDRLSVQSATQPIQSSLPSLRVLKLTNNPQLLASIDGILTLTPKLETLSFSGSNVLGPIFKLSELHDLKYLDISETTFSATLDRSFWSLPSLQVVNLTNTQISGSIESSIGNMKNLTYLAWVSNQLGGSIPASIGQCEALEAVILSSDSSLFTGLQGTLPMQLGDLKLLQTLCITNTSLHGALPPEIGQLTHLDILRISNSFLSGTIPSTYSQLNISTLDLQTNRLEGPLPEFSSNIDYVDLSDNRLGGTIPLSLASQARMIYLGNNRLGPALSYDLFSSNSRLALLDLSHNHFGLHSQEEMNLASSDGLQVTLPTIANSASGVILDLSFNNFSGNIPSSYCEKASRVTLNNNALSGDLSTFIGNSSRLCRITHLYLSSNNFSGNLGLLQTETSLIELDISHNNFSGMIVPLPSNLERFVASNNSFGFTLVDSFVDSASNVQYIDISHNQIECPIDAWLYDQSDTLRKLLSYPSLKYLNLAHNKFSCSIGVLSEHQLAPLSGLDLYVHFISP